MKIIDSNPILWSRLLFRRGGKVPSNTDASYHDELNHSLTFFNSNDKKVGKLSFSNEIKFEGDVDASAKVFFDTLIKHIVVEKWRFLFRNGGYS